MYAIRPTSSFTGRASSKARRIPIATFGGIDTITGKPIDVEELAQSYRRSTGCRRR